MSTFAKQVQQAVENTIVKTITEANWLQVDYAQRLRVPMAMLEECYEAIDMARVKARLVDRLEDKLADKIFNALATEIATDVKSIMSNSELRESCRAILRQHMKDAAKQLRESNE